MSQHREICSRIASISVGPEATASLPLSMASQPASIIPGTRGGRDFTRSRCQLSRSVPRHPGPPAPAQGSLGEARAEPPVGRVRGPVADQAAEARSLGRSAISALPGWPARSSASEGMHSCRIGSKPRRDRSSGGAPRSRRQRAPTGGRRWRAPRSSSHRMDDAQARSRPAAPVGITIRAWGRAVGLPLTACPLWYPRRIAERFRSSL